MKKNKILLVCALALGLPSAVSNLMHNVEPIVARAEEEIVCDLTFPDDNSSIIKLVLMLILGQQKKEIMNLKFPTETIILGKATGLILNLVTKKKHLLEQFNLKLYFQILLKKLN